MTEKNREFNVTRYPCTIDRTDKIYVYDAGQKQTAIVWETNRPGTGCIVLTQDDAIAFANDVLRASGVEGPSVQIIKRPVRTVCSLVVPEDGLYQRRFEGGEIDVQNGPMRFLAGDVMPCGIEAIRRIDTDEPTTWIRGTITVRPREWRESDIPNDKPVRVYWKGGTEGWSTNAGSTVIRQANKNDAHAIMVLPTSIP